MRINNPIKKKSIQNIQEKINIINKSRNLSDFYFDIGDLIKDHNNKFKDNINIMYDSETFYMKLIK